MAVSVSLPVSLFTPAVRNHSEGVSWRVTKKGKLLIFGSDGREVARYKSSAWVSVWWQP